MDNADCLSSLPESKLGRKRDTSAAPPVSPTVVKRRGHGSALDAYLHNRMVNMQGDKNHQNKPVSAKNIKIQPAGVTTGVSVLTSNTPLSLKDTSKKNLDDNTTSGSGKNPKRRGRGPSIMTILQRNKENISENKDIFTGTFKEPLAADLDSAVTTQCNVLRSQNSTMSSNCNLYGRTDLQAVGTNNENEKIIRFTSHNKGKRPIPTDGKTKSPDYKRKNKVVSNDISSDFREKGTSDLKGSENTTPVPISSFMQSNIDTSGENRYIQNNLNNKRCNEGSSSGARNLFDSFNEADEPEHYEDEYFDQRMHKLDIAGVVLRHRQYWIENHSLFLPIRFQQVDGSTDSWQSLLHNSSASFSWEDLGRPRQLELLVDGDDRSKSLKYSIDEISDHQPVFVTEEPTRVLRPAPPPPPGTPPVNSENRNRKLSDNNSSDGGSKKSGIGGGGVAEIFISILVVGAVVAFFIVKRRSKKSSADIEKADSQPFTSYTSQEVQGAFPFAEEYYLDMAEACLSSQVEEDGPVRKSKYKQQI
ncbi:hypothetical protein AgCh_000461 [Apium graveolens]